MTQSPAGHAVAAVPLPVYEYLTADEAADLTRIPTGTLGQWRSNGVGPKWIRLGARRILYARGHSVFGYR
ncbi:MAG: hypothetical protein QOH56_2798 [Pseudonocardiales bacterium]|jgi:hypothetical protein|nr:hypothetical protein [Pseudonocardiales bacterium]